VPRTLQTISLDIETSFASRRIMGDGRSLGGWYEDT
jgi:hypothetical protein